MAAFGKNMKLTVDQAQRDKTRILFSEILGCKAVHPAPQLDAYKLDDGFSIGCYFVDTVEALGPEQQMKNAWLEFCVDDVDATIKKLDDLGLERHDYSAVDKAHAYFRAPGGQVFRLVSK
jgi:hypothetical protein